MGLKPLVASIILISLAFAGCSGANDENPDPTTSGSTTSTSSGSSTGTGTSSSSTGPRVNHAPTGAINASVSNGAIPLLVNFTLSGHDADGDALNWTLAFGDGNQTNGTQLPAKVGHNFTAGGAFNVTYTLTDGRNSTIYSTLVNATGGSVSAPTQGPTQLKGTVTCLPTIVQNGEIEGGSHELVVQEGQTRLTLTLTYEDPSGEGVTDLDFEVTDSAGKGQASEEVGPEPPLVFENPKTGTWTLAITGYSCAGQADYTVDAVFG
ncbi:MAG: PKD domain-containing protein [Candidatus Thermoplasmatota archaeon]|jgi:hypothetical protein